MSVNRSKQSREHHWWPVGLQTYWADHNGDVSWIEPNGKIGKKKVRNRKIGFRIHGHTVLRGSVWENNFEKDFEIDQAVHELIQRLTALGPLGKTPREFLEVFRRLIKKERNLSDICKYYALDEKLHRKLLLFILSLLLRSPAKRREFEHYPKTFGLPPSEDVGKANMAQLYRIAKNLCQSGPISNHHFVLLHSPPLKRFICGDGCLDWLSGLPSQRISGRALVPLTPRLCVYFCTPMMKRGSQNCASLIAAPWMVDWINEITQIHSGKKLFFLGRPPLLIGAFRRDEFLQYQDRSDELISMLDQVSGNTPEQGLWSMRRPGILPI